MFLVNSGLLELDEVTCGTGNFTFSGTFPYMIAMAILIIKIAIPVLLIIFGMLDLGKAVVASKEDEIKKGQQILIKRAISAVIVFFIIQIVQIVIRFVAGSNGSTVSQCMNCFVYGEIGPNSCVKQ